ncbi:MAG: regulatory iron-sulfur-containing complex subunit RicT [Planctomycetota bacterium]
MANGENITTRQTKPKGAGQKLMLVRYGKMGHMGWFEHHEKHIPKLHMRVILQTERGLEIGEVVGPFCYRGGQFRQSREQVNSYFQAQGAKEEIPTAGTVVRFANTQDIIEERHLEKNAREEMQCCKRFVKELNLKMRLVEAEHIFGGERIIFYFTAEGRVDFRELVKKLAHEYQTRIEMRQIGSRDEAKLLSDVEVCGQECCCKRFLKILKPVNMRMAKLQKATLDPSKISGYCGRLRCCLRYEDETYTDLKRQLPRKNSRVKCSYGLGRVVDTQVLTQLVVIQTDDGKEFALPFEEIEIVTEAPAEANDKNDFEQDTGEQDSLEEEADTTNQAEEN